jgi:adenosine deaminase
MATPFVEDLISSDIDAIRRCPKADLLNHCGGSSDRELMRKRTGIDVAPLACKLRSMDETYPRTTQVTGARPGPK